MKKVFLVSHVHELPSGEEEFKIIGIFTTEESARVAIDRAKVQPGFVNTPEGFHSEGYELDKAEWLEGFLTWTPPAS